jgi:hypothetical protein
MLLSSRLLQSRGAVIPGLAESVIPSTCPWTAERLRDDAFWPEE